MLANAQLAIDLIKGNAASVLWRTQLLQLYLISLFTMSLQYYLWFTVDRFYVTWAFRYSVLFHVLCHWFYVFFCTQCRCVRCAFVITVSALCSLRHIGYGDSATQPFALRGMSRTFGLSKNKLAIVGVDTNNLKVELRPNFVGLILGPWSMVALLLFCYQMNAVNYRNSSAMITKHCFRSFLFFLLL